MKFQCPECKRVPHTMVRVEPAVKDGPNMKCEVCGFECVGYVVTDGPAPEGTPLSLGDALRRE